MKSLAIVFFAIQLAACAGTTRGGPSPAVYDFGLPAASLAGGVAWARLALDVRAPSWFDGRSIAYRLAYDDPLKLREYAESRWAGPPALLLGQRLRQQLGVFGASSNTALDCLLRFDLTEFSQVFDTPQQSRGALHGRASLVDAKRRVVAEQTFAIERPAAVADARGGVGALVAASDDLGRRLANWLNTLEKEQGLRGCGSTPAGR
ncbi:MAG: membrane integrity-associated transporter subunit PqiC [Betaproteobacteria bacterium]|nr:membrane integrity-associated transporter subunit PqiC [Betaproteobacteria bacterium]